MSVYPSSVAIPATATSAGVEHFTNHIQPATPSDVAFVDGSLTSAAAPAMTFSADSCMPMTASATTSREDMRYPRARQQQAAYIDVSGTIPNYSQSIPDNSLASYTDTIVGTGGGFSSSGSVSAVWSSPATASAATVRSDETTRTRKRRRTQSPARCHLMPAGLPWSSGIAGEDGLARVVNSNLIGQTMMKIYHDVMEGALSCWLTEQSCPYNTIVLVAAAAAATDSEVPRDLLQQQKQQQLWGTLEDMRQEWGPNWSNRVYRRVVKLDRMTHSLGLRRLSPAEERKVCAALNAAVMAFTAQWAQASPRSTTRWSAVQDEMGTRLLDVDFGEAFDRTLQKSLWNQARKALDDCTEIDSFRVVFAEIIFGLTQKYFEKDAQQNSDDLFEGRGEPSQVVEDIIGQDTQQVWLERATRRLQVLRRRVELHDRRMRDKQNEGGQSCYDAECRKTIDLLFWLAVMFDTISAAMTERPLTVSDEDSSNLALGHPSHHDHSAPINRDTAKRWNVILAKDLQTKRTSLRWPCADVEIAQELTDAAPVKVLLYRKITRLQTLIARDMESATIEEAIRDSLDVYAHWQAIYSGLFSDCIENHPVLSARIQSWYVCLFGHWLLATLLLVDLVEIVDQRQMGGVDEMIQRTEEDTVYVIRKSSVRLVSDLARASAPRHDFFSELENYHHAINEGALLTEPWTMILLRLFSRSSIILLENTVNFDTTSTDLDATFERERGNLERCRDCNKALWYLGRKSDMAREVANVLGVALQHARVRAGEYQHEPTTCWGPNEVNTNMNICISGT